MHISARDEASATAALEFDSKPIVMAIKIRKHTPLLQRVPRIVKFCVELLRHSVEAVARVAEPRHDVAELVESLIQRA